MAFVREGIDYSETIHNYLSSIPSDIIMQILQVSILQSDMLPC